MILNYYLFKVNNRNSRKKCELCSKLTKAIDVILVSPFSGVSIVDFEKVGVYWATAAA